MSRRGNRHARRSAVRRQYAEYPRTDPRLRSGVEARVHRHWRSLRSCGLGNAKNSNGPIGSIHNGADDNASGSASLLELAQALKSLPVAPKRSIILAWWDGEEINLLGSKHWLKNPTIDLKNLKASINMDMVGRLRKDKVEVYGTRTAPGWRNLVNQANQSDPLRMDYTWVMKADSDHHPFFDANFPVIMLHTGLHDNYHRPSDDVQTLNIEGIERVSKLLFEITMKLGDELPIGSFRASSKRETPDTRTQRERPLPPLGGRLGVALIREGKRAAGSRSRRSCRAQDRLRSRACEEATACSNLMASRSGRRNVSTFDSRRPGECHATCPACRRNEPLELPLKLSGDPVRWGITWREDDAEPGMLYLLRVIDGTPAALAGVKVGDRIVSVNGQSFANQDEFQNLVSADENRSTTGE